MAKVKHSITFPVAYQFILAEMNRFASDKGERSLLHFYFPAVEKRIEDLNSLFEAFSDTLFDAYANEELPESTLAHIADQARKDYKTHLDSLSEPGKRGRSMNESTVKGLTKIMEQKGLTEEAFNALPEADRRKLQAEARVIGKYL